MSFKRFLAVLDARNREFWRDRSALAWNFIFPVFIVAGFAFAFSGKLPDLYKVGVYPADATTQIDLAENGKIFSTEYLQFIPMEQLDAAVTKVERHQLDMLIDVNDAAYWINERSPKGYMMERVLRGTDGERFERQTVSGEEVRYVDWLLPGVIGMNMMFSALFGVGYVIVRYRKNGVLKRLSATPLSALEFLTAQVISRLWLIMVVSIIVFVGTDLFIHFTMRGSYLDLFLVACMGAFSLICMGMLVAARLASEEFAGGLLNMVSWPMMFLSGVWFSLEGVHPLVQQFALLLPLTHMIDAARAIMIDGAGLADVSLQMMVMAGMSLLFLIIGSLSFRWE